MRTILALLFVVLNCALLCSATPASAGAYAVTFKCPAINGLPSMTGTGSLVIGGADSTDGNGNDYYQLQSSSTATITVGTAAPRTDCKWQAVYPGSGTGTPTPNDGQTQSNFETSTWSVTNVATSTAMSFDNFFGPGNSGQLIIDQIGIVVACGAAGGASSYAWSFFYGVAGSNGLTTSGIYCAVGSQGTYSSSTSSYSGDAEYTTTYTPNLFYLTPSGTVQSDPIVTGFDGVQFDFKGLPNRVFNMFSIGDLQITSHLIPTQKVGETYTSAIGVRQAGASSILFDLNGAYVFPQNVSSDKKHLAKYIPFPMDAPYKLANGGVLTRPSAGKVNIDFPSYSIHMVRIYEIHEGVEVDYLDFSLSINAILDPKEVGGVLGQTYRSNSTVRNTNPADFVAVETTPFDVFTNDFPAASFKYTHAPAKHVTGDAQNAAAKHKK